MIFFYRVTLIQAKDLMQKDVAIVGKGNIEKRSLPQTLSF